MPRECIKACHDLSNTPATLCSFVFMQVIILNLDPEAGSTFRETGSISQLPEMDFSEMKPLSAVQAQ